MITGAGRGIGKAIAIAFAKEGCDCAIVDIEPVSANEVAYEISSLGRRAVSIKADVSKGDDVKLMVEEVVKKFGRIDILVNNAGIWTFANAEDLSEEDCDRTMDVNLKGARATRYRVYANRSLQGG